MSMKKIKTAIENNKSFLITSHINLEGDSLGCQLAIYRLLTGLGKKAAILDADQPPRQYKFLPHVDLVNKYAARDIDYDVCIVLDCPVIERVGRIKKLLDRKKQLINIDHHISNSFFGDINWVSADASSCGEMVYELFQEFNLPINKESALLLYVAIMTDTGSFGYENTGAKTHMIVKDLIDKGLKPVEVYSKIYENKSFAEIKLLQKALSTLKLTRDGKIAYLYVTRRMIAESGCAPSVTEGFVNFARSIEGVKVALLFMENPCEQDKIQISFRSKGECDVNKMAALFNGGGHRNAAGCVITGKLGSVIKKVLSALEKKICTR